MLTNGLGTREAGQLRFNAVVSKPNSYLLAAEDGRWKWELWRRHEVKVYY